MKKPNLQAMLRKFADNWELVTLLIAGTTLLVIDFLPETVVQNIELTTEGYLGAILAALLAVASSQLRSDPQTLHNNFLKSQQKLDDILVLSRGNISAVRPDLEPGIWEGFKNNYFAVNAPWLLEQRSNEPLEAMVEKHARRYRDEEFNRATYVFFTHGESRQYFPKALERFGAFARQLLVSAPEVADKVEVIVADQPAPAFTLFLGEKKADAAKSTEQFFSYSILYINEAPLMSRTGLPKWAFVSVDESLNTSLQDFVKDVSDEYEPMGLEQFLREYRPPPEADGRAAG